MTSPTETKEVKYKIGNESLIKVLPNAADRLLGLLKKQGRAEKGALRVAVVGGGCSGCSTRWTWSTGQRTVI